MCIAADLSSMMLAARYDGLIGRVWKGIPGSRCGTQVSSPG